MKANKSVTNENNRSGGKNKEGGGQMSLVVPLYCSH